MRNYRYLALGILAFFGTASAGNVLNILDVPTSGGSSSLATLSAGTAPSSSGTYDFANNNLQTTGFLGIGGAPAAQINILGAVAAGAWGSSGIQFRTNAATFTDTSSSGTVAAASVANFGTPTLAASSATTYTQSATLRIGGAPISGTNVTQTEPLAFLVNSGNVHFQGSTFTSDNSQIFGDATHSFTEHGPYVGDLNGAASVPALKLTGTWFSGGTGTTTKCQMLIETTGAVTTAWNTAGSGFCVNAASGFAGNLIDAKLNGVSEFSVAASNGSATINSSGNTGLILGNLVSNATFGAIYSTAVTPSSTNYAVVAGSTQTNLNAVTTANLTVGGAVKAAATSTGLAITGILSSSGNITGAAHYGSTGTAPTIAGTGCVAGTAPAPTDAKGSITATAATSCTVTFGSGYTTAPACTVSSSSTTLPAAVSSISTGVLTIGVATLTGTVYYICIQ